MKTLIITRQTMNQGRLTLIIYRKARAYHVGVIHPSQQVETLDDATFWTYGAAHERMQQEVTLYCR